MRLLICLMACCLGQPVYAQSVFDLIASGPREQTGSDVVQCGVLTLRFDFYDQNQRMSLMYTDDILDFEGTYRSRGDYDVVAVEDRAVVLALDSESRLTPNGDTVQWILRVTEGGTTCWQRADLGVLDCTRFTVPCPGTVPLS